MSHDSESPPHHRNSFRPSKPWLYPILLTTRARFDPCSSIRPTFPTGTRVLASMTCPNHPGPRSVFRFRFHFSIHDHLFIWPSNLRIQSKPLSNPIPRPLQPETHNTNIPVITYDKGKVRTNIDETCWNVK